MGFPIPGLESKLPWTIHFILKTPASNKLDRGGQSQAGKALVLLFNIKHCWPPLAMHRVMTPSAAVKSAACSLRQRQLSSTLLDERISRGHVRAWISFIWWTIQILTLMSYTCVLLPVTAAESQPARTIPYDEMWFPTGSLNGHIYRTAHHWDL